MTVCAWGCSEAITPLPPAVVAAVAAELGVAVGLNREGSTGLEEGGEGRGGGGVSNGWISKDPATASLSRLRWMVSAPRRRRDALRRCGTHSSIFINSGRNIDVAGVTEEEEVEDEDDPDEVYV